MALTKVGKYWKYDFIYKKKRYQGSTHQTNVNKARLVEAKKKSEIALEAFGIGPEKPCPTLTEFLEGDFQRHADTHAKAKRTAAFYREKVKRILDFPKWKDAKLSAIDGELIGKYCAYRSRDVENASINGELATLRKALNLAEEWKLIKRAPRIHILPGVKGREFVVSGELEADYLAAAGYPLRFAAILILDLGLRPEECLRLRKSDLINGALIVREGKSKHAARAITLTERARGAVKLLCELWPDSEFLFPGRKGKHYTRGALDNLHTKLRNKEGWPAEFVLYSFRHTFGTRLAESSGGNAFQIKGLMGHSTITTSQKYIHPQPDELSLAMKRKEALDKLIRGEDVPTDSTTPDRKALK